MLTNSSLSTTIIVTTPSQTSNAVPTIVITLLVIGAAIGISVGLSRLIEYCCVVRRIDDDDASDMSEHTKSLLQLQLDLLKRKVKEIKEGIAYFRNRPQPPPDDKETAKKVVHIWATKASLNLDIKSVAENYNEEDNNELDDLQIIPNNNVPSTSKNIGQPSSPATKKSNTRPKTGKSKVGKAKVKKQPTSGVKKKQVKSKKKNSPKKSKKSGK